MFSGIDIMTKGTHSVPSHGTPHVAVSWYTTSFIAGTSCSWSALLLCVVHLLFCTVTRELISALVKFKIVSLSPEVSNYPASRATSTPMSALLMNKHSPLHPIKFKLSRGLKHSIVLVPKNAQIHTRVSRRDVFRSMLLYYSIGGVAYI